MLAAGLWSRARRRSPHRRRRERMAHFGELVQLDGSFHPWFERRGPPSCLLTMVDDATGRSLGTFGAQETSWAALGVRRAWIAQYGIPHALYTDWKNVYVRPPNQEERATGAEPLTQFGRMCAKLGIRIIPASSPQAKGRIERHHGTHRIDWSRSCVGRRSPTSRRPMPFSRRNTGRITMIALPARRHRRTTSIEQSRAACRWITSFGSRRRARSPMTGALCESPLAIGAAESAPASTQHRPGV